MDQKTQWQREAALAKLGIVTSAQEPFFYFNGGMKHQLMQVAGEITAADLADALGIGPTLAGKIYLEWQDALSARDAAE